jgi:hypothetical protein
MVISSDADRHAARPAPPPGAEDGTVTGEDGALAGLVALGAGAAGADVGAAGCPVVGAAGGGFVGAAGCAVVVGGSPPPAGWLVLGEAQATRTDDTATAAPASSAALGNVNDGLKNALGMGVILPCSC